MAIQNRPPILLFNHPLKHKEDISSLGWSESLPCRIYAVFVNHDQDLISIWLLQMCSASLGLFHTLSQLGTPWHQDDALKNKQNTTEKKKKVKSLKRTEFKGWRRRWISWRANQRAFSDIPQRFFFFCYLWKISYWYWFITNVLLGSCLPFRRTLTGIDKQNNSGPDRQDGKYWPWEKDWFVWSEGNLVDWGNTV